MTQDERWLAKYNEVMAFMEKNKRNPSKYDYTERGLYCNWIHHNKKLLKAGTLKEYPLFFLALQRLHKLGFIDLKMPISELQEIFDSAISKSKNKQFIEGLDAYYYQSDGVSTPEFELLVSKVREINAHNNQQNLSAEFEAVVNDKNSSESLSKYEHVLTNMFHNIEADRFFELFVSLRNSRKREYWNFFDERYNSKDCFDLDREFINKFREILSNYLSDKSVEASGTRKYCSKMLELLDKKVQQFGCES